jgi:adenosine deaminase
LHRPPLLRYWKEIKAFETSYEKSEVRTLRGQGVGSRDLRAESREQRTENREQRTEDREQRTENREQTYGA